MATSTRSFHKKKFWDVVTATSSYNIGMVGIFRNSYGDILATFYSMVLSHLKPKIAEPEALRKAMIICWELNLLNIIFEGDCQSVVQAINGARNFVEELNPILLDIWFMLQQAQGWSVSFVHREVNQVAHNLAKLAFSFDYDRFWLERCPSFVLSLILEEKLQCNSQ